MVKDHNRNGLRSSGLVRILVKTIVSILACIGWRTKGTVDVWVTASAARLSSGYLWRPAFASPKQEVT
jgi:hypothetical protein